MRSKRRIPDERSLVAVPAPDWSRKQRGGGRAVAGQSIGILCLDSSYELLRGNVQHAASFPFPVQYEPIACDDLSLLFSGDPALTELLVEGARRLEQRGADVICGACGSFVYHQDAVRAAVGVPVFLSVMLLAPLLLGSLSPAAKLGIICVSRPSMNARAFAAAGIAESERLAIAAMSERPEFDRMLAGAPAIDRDRLEEETIAAATDLVAAAPETGAILLQCSDLPPFAAAVTRATARPVFDMLGLIRLAHTALHPPVFEP